MTEIEIRRLAIGDLGLLVDVTDGIFDHAVDAMQAAAFLEDPGHEIVVALEDGEAVGMATATVLLHPDKQPQLFIAEVGVHEGWRRRGIATRLVAALHDIGREHHCSGVWLATEADNDAARGLYSASGARETEGIVVYDWGAEL